MPINTISSPHSHDDIGRFSSSAMSTIYRAPSCPPKCLSHLPVIASGTNSYVMSIGIAVAFINPYQCFRVIREIPTGSLTKETGLNVTIMRISKPTSRRFVLSFSRWMFFSSKGWKFPLFHRRVSLPQQQQPPKPVQIIAGQKRKEGRGKTHGQGEGW